MRQEDYHRRQLVEKDAAIRQKIEDYGEKPGKVKSNGSAPSEKEPPEAMPKFDACLPYKIKNGQICVSKNTSAGPVDAPLCNFTARVKEEVVLDDGAETTRAFQVEGKLDTGMSLPSVRVPASRFAGMNWVADSWGLSAVVRAGFSTRDQLREAIQRLSPDAKRRQIFTHTGWRELDGTHVYLTAGGAVGREGCEVDIGPELALYSLPQRPQDPVGAMRASLSLLNVAPLTVTAPLFASIFRAPLASALPVDVSLWLEGQTGSLKSTLAALYLSHFGRFERISLPGNFLSTANQLERRAFQLKDAPFVIDDYAPSGTDAREMQAKAERLLRSQGNLSSRGRLRSDLTERINYRPRGLSIVTGEQHPPGQSILARTLLVEVNGLQVNMELLTDAQKSADRLPHAMAGFLTWLAPQIPTLPALLKETMEGARQRATADGEHLRIPEVLAHFWLGIHSAFAYAEDIGACTHAEAEVHRSECWGALLTLGRTQGRLVEGHRSTRRFLQVLWALLTQGHVLLLQKDDERKPSPIDPQFIGWRDDDFLYLIPEAAHKAVVMFCRDSGDPFPIRAERVLKDFSKEGLSKPGKNRNTASVRIGDQPRRVLRLHLAKVEKMLGQELPVGSGEKNVTAVTAVTAKNEGRETWHTE